MTVFTIEATQLGAASIVPCESSPSIDASSEVAGYLASENAIIFRGSG
jgi:hypothetical protein